MVSGGGCFGVLFGSQGGQGELVFGMMSRGLSILAVSVVAVAAVVAVVCCRRLWRGGAPRTAWAVRDGVFCV